MSVQPKPQFHISRKRLLLISLIVVLLISSLFVYVWMMEREPIHVTNETALRRTVDNAKEGVTTVIFLDNSINLSWPFNIPAGKDITLTSNSEIEFFKLIGISDTDIIRVNGGGVLRLDGIVVTTASGTGGGVQVWQGGTLILCDGEISGNNKDGVYNSGTFTMLSGKIANNRGGVYNRGPFELFGGEISGNTDYGVYNWDVFSMSGGEISGNTANGVYNEGVFSMSGGEISGNIATVGGGVYNRGTFELSGGVIRNNSAIGDGASNGGGGVLNHGSFSMSGGEISHNNALWYGGGVHNFQGNFNMSGGVISYNTAGWCGGGLFTRFNGNFSLTGGNIYGNIADVGSDVEK